MTPVLTAEGLAIGYGKRVLMEGIDLSLERGSLTALIGRNGVGKSTLLKTLTGSLPSLAGTIKLEGRPLKGMSRKDMSRILALVSTDRHNAGGLRLEEMVALGRIPFTNRFGVLRHEDREIVDKAMKDVGIYHKKDRFVAELSDGERQKGLLARGLAQQTPVLVMDEPFSFLDVASRLEILQLIKRLTGELNRAILFSTHEVTEALRSADNVWAFVGSGGDQRIVSCSPSQLIDSGEVNSIFTQNNIIFDSERMDYKLKDN